MFGTGQLEPLETNVSHASHVESGIRYRRSDDQCLPLVISLAGDMPLRLAAAHPHDCPNVTAAIMRLRRFVRFYPAFAGAALFDTNGRLIAKADFHSREDQKDDETFEIKGLTASPGVIENDDLADAISTFGGETLLHAGVKCPHSDANCGILVTRLR